MRTIKTSRLVICTSVILVFAASAFSQKKMETNTEIYDRPAVPVNVVSSENQVLGRVTDFAGRSIRSARITLFCLDSDQVHRTSTNTFGYYQFKTLTEGHSYLVSIDHARYLFLSGSISVTVAEEPIEIDFQAQRRP